MITDNEHLATLIVQAYGRAIEVYSYQINIDNYTAMLESLPADSIPERLEQYASTDLVNLPLDMSDADVQLISDYQYRNRLKMLLRTERAEQNKVQRILDVLKTQIGPTADADILAYKASLTP